MILATELYNGGNFERDIMSVKRKQTYLHNNRSPENVYSYQKYMDTVHGYSCLSLRWLYSLTVKGVCSYQSCEISIAGILQETFSIAYISSRNLFNCKSHCNIQQKKYFAKFWLKLCINKGPAAKFISYLETVSQ